MSFGADGTRQSTPRAKTAARGRIDGVRRITLERRFGAPASRIHGRTAGQKRARIGVRGAAEDLFDRADLGDLAQIHDKHAVGCVGGSTEQVGALRQYCPEAGTTLTGEIRVQRVEVHPDRATIHGERREDVAPAGKCDKTEPVSLEVLNQAPCLASRALQPTGCNVLGQHGAADIHGQHQTERAAFRLNLGTSRARAGETDGTQESNQAEHERCPSTAVSRQSSKGSRPPLGHPEPLAAREPRTETEGEGQDGRQQQKKGCVESHGTRTMRVLPRRSSRPRAAKPRRMRGRVVSLYRV
jgi:hypothetical protein